MYEVNILIGERAKIQSVKPLVFHLLHVMIQEGQWLWQFTSVVLMSLFSLIVFACRATYALGLWNMKNNIFFSCICFVLLLTSFGRKNATVKTEFSVSF